MKKLITLFLILCLTLGCATSLFACSPDTGGGGDGDGGGGGGDAPPPIDNSVTIIVPDYKDYGRGTVNLSLLVYSRPDVSRIVEDALTLTSAVREEQSDWPVIADKLSDLIDRRAEADSMEALAKISAARDITQQFWREECDYYSDTERSLESAFDTLLYTLAESKHKSEVEGLLGYTIDGYLNYVNLTSELVTLYEREAELLLEHSRLSPETVEISYNEESGTYAQMKKALAEKYGEGTDKYISLNALYNTLYNNARRELSEGIYLELLKTRYRIAEELGYSSYLELVLAESGCGLSFSEADRIIEAATAALPAISTLIERIAPAFSSGAIPTQDYEVTVNDAYSIYRAMDEKLGDAFAYMLQHGLYDIDTKSDKRNPEGFTVYMPDNSSPVIFATLSENLLDYKRLASVMGGFFDGYINNSLTDSEYFESFYALSSELLLTSRLDKKLSASSFEYVRALCTYNILYDLHSAVMSASFERAAYALPYEELTSERLNALAGEVGDTLFDTVGSGVTLSDFVSAKSISSPLSGDAYICAVLGAVQLLERETAEKGAGADIFVSLLGSERSSYIDEISENWLDSPLISEAFTRLLATLNAFVFGSRAE